MNNQIYVANDELRKPVKYFIDSIKENMNIDLNSEIILEEQEDRYIELLDQTFTDYEVYNYELFEIAGHLYNEGYNILEKAIELENDSQLLINEIIKEFVADTIEQHQVILIEQKNDLPKIKIK